MSAQPRVVPPDDDDLAISGADRIEALEGRLAKVETRTGRLELAWAMVTGGGIVVVAVIGYAMWIAERLWK